MSRWNASVRSVGLGTSTFLFKRTLNHRLGPKTIGICLALSRVRSIVTVGRTDLVNRIKSATVAMLLATMVTALPAPVLAQGKSQRDRYEDRWDRHEDKRESRRDRRDYQDVRREAQRERREDRADARRDYWDASRDYRQDNRSYRARRMNRSDRVYRGSDNRYYCQRDNGTTGLIIGGVAGGVLGNIIAPGGSKLLGSIIGAGAGALIGRAIDDGDMVCR